MAKRRFAFALTALGIALMPLCPKCPAQEIPGIDKAADRIAQKLHEKRRKG